MSNGTVRAMTAVQAKDIAVALAQAALTDLTFKQAGRLLRDRGGLISGAQALQRQLVGDPQADVAELPTVTVVLVYEVGSETIEAVSVTSTRNDFTVEDALGAADNGHFIRTDEEWGRISKNRTTTPHELEGYVLVTALPNPNDPRDVSCLDRTDDEWFIRWHSLDYRWYRDNLVLRRRV